MERVRERLNPDLSLVGIVPCRVDLRTNLSRAIVQRLRERFADLVFDSTIRENVRLAEGRGRKERRLRLTCEGIR
jgi:chromosome partitioning protein